MREFKEMIIDTIINDSAGFILGVAITAMSVMLFNGIADVIVRIAILILE